VNPPRWLFVLAVLGVTMLAAVTTFLSITGDWQTGVLSAVCAFILVNLGGSAIVRYERRPTVKKTTEKGPRSDRVA